MCCHLDKIPGPGQGWRVADIATSFSGCSLFEDWRTEEAGVFYSFFVSFKNAVLTLQILCMMGMWQYRQELAYAWTDGWASSAFLCSFVLMSWLFGCILLVVKWDPWSWPGMTMLVDIAFGGCTHFLDRRTEEQKLWHWMSECLFKRAWHTSVYSM